VDRNGVPAPSARGPMGFARKFANRAFTETIAIPEGHGNGHGEPGAVEEGERAAIGGGHDEH
jgi:quinol---cytochrome-c reductase cytochrome b subunit